MDCTWRQPNGWPARYGRTHGMSACMARAAAASPRAIAASWGPPPWPARPAPRRCVWSSCGPDGRVVPYQGASGRPRCGRSAVCRRVRRPASSGPAAGDVAAERGLLLAVPAEQAIGAAAAGTSRSPTAAGCRCGSGPPRSARWSARWRSVPARPRPVRQLATACPLGCHDGYPRPCGSYIRRSICNQSIASCNNRPVRGSPEVQRAQDHDDCHQRQRGHGLDEQALFRNGPPPDLPPKWPRSPGRSRTVSLASSPSRSSRSCPMSSRPFAVP